jgi:hypothetical protein
MTLEAWVFPTSVTNAWRDVLYKADDAYYLEATTSSAPTPSVGGTFGGSGTNIVSPNAIAANTWTHLAATYDGSTLRLYVNGVQVASLSQTGSLATSSNPLQIGGDSLYGQFFSGRIDEVRVYRTALSQTEIQTDMANPVTPNPNAPKLVITAPAEASTVTGGAANIVYTTTGDLTGVDHVHFQVDNDPVKMDLTFDGAYTFSGIHVGSHTLNGWLVRSDHSKIAGTDATPVHFSNVVDPADPTQPTVSVTAPQNGASVFGAVAVTANASDNVGVYGVQFKLDGAPLGLEDLSPPYGVNWDTTLGGNGSHVLTATVRDAAGNETASTPVTVSVVNSGSDPAQVGSWSSPTTLPIIPIHTSMLPNGKLLIFDSEPTGNERVWDPVANTFTQVPYSTVNMFCASHTPLPDGRILVAGGHIDAYIGERNTTIFDPATNTWTDVQPMTYARWYPTVTKLPDGRMLALSGAINCPDCVTPGAAHNGIAGVPEIFDPATNTWSPVTGASANLRLPIYPHVYVLPDGRIFVASAHQEPLASRVLDLTTKTWSVVDPNVRDGGSSVMYLPGKILKTGTAWNPDYPVKDASAEAWAIDMNQVAPTWRQVAPMAFPRTQHQLTVLPDGTVLATGGSRNTDVGDRASAVLAAELWDPTTETWHTLSSGAVPRLYHSSAILLPDGRVEIAGGGHPGGFGVPEFRSEIFSPPYLFRGARPTITSAPSQANYGQSFFVATPDGGSISKVALIPQPTPTHAYNSNAGYIPLTFSQTAGGLTVTAPPNGNIATPGKYMLFILNANGVPSVASWVQVSAATGQAAQALRAGAKPSSTWAVLAYGGRLPVPAPAPTTPGPALTPTSVFLDLTPRASAPGETVVSASYGERLLCTLATNRKTTRAPPGRGPP